MNRKSLITLALCGLLATALTGCSMYDVDSETHYASGGCHVRIEYGLNYLPGTFTVNGEVITEYATEYDFTDKAEHVLILEYKPDDAATHFHYTVRPGKHVLTTQTIYSNPAVITVKQSEVTITLSM